MAVEASKMVALMGVELGWLKNRALLKWIELGI